MALEESAQSKLIEETFQVGDGTHFWTGLVDRRPRLWQWLGRMEGRVFAEELAEIPVDRPIFIAGLARSGSTILLEFLAAHPQVTTHRYRDYPPLHTPIWWDRLLARMSRENAQARERAHGDGILVTPESPEALEEVLWMSFFPGLHESGRDQVLTREQRHPAFDAYYREHIRKILLLNGRSRYATKENYNLSRLAYLHALFPDAVFLIPVRAPREHLASLRKQHALFTAGETRFPRALDHMRRVGHFEFGLDRRPVQYGPDPGPARSVEELWRAGQETRGWARGWAQAYGHVLGLLAADDALARATRLVRYDQLCADPAGQLAEILERSGLEAPPGFLRDWAGRIAAPTYYRARFTEEEEAAIREETDSVATALGFDAGT
jgi:hypothetical protein